MASKLILTLDGSIIREYPVEKPSLSIGRKHENDIQINDLTVSGRHALITSQGGKEYVEDLGSTNGTLVNGKYINKETLGHGNIIQIGHHLFTYFTDAQEVYEPTMFIAAEHDETQIVLPEWEMDKDSINLRGQPLGALRKINDPFGHPGIEMRKTYSTLGFQGKKVALINRGSKGYNIVGISSNRSRRATDIPLLNGKELTNDPKPLNEKDIISIAGVDMEFYYIQ